MTVVDNANARAMRIFAAALARAGVTDACISPGSRSAPAALALVQTGGVRVWVINDERAAGFFALGMARERRRPVALLCTSGTAAANYLPALVEASWAQIPLVVLTADRPPELRDCHAAQTIDQVRLFGSHVRWSVDAPPPTAAVDLDGYFRTLAHRAVAAAVADPRGPVHVNLPMREPLLDVADERARLDLGAAATVSSAADAGPDLCVHPPSGLPSAATIRVLAQVLGRADRGVIVCGPGASSDGEPAAIVRLADRLGWPVLADPLSGLRFGRHDRTYVVDAYDLLLQGEMLGAAWHPDAVLQLGTPTVSASLPSFLATARARPFVVVAAPGSWPDPLQCATDVVRAEATALCAALVDELPPRRAAGSAWARTWCDVAARARVELDRRLADEDELFEGNVLVQLIERLPAGSALHVGNSLPVRALDTFVGGTHTTCTIECYANRGANGIDGVVATALGAAVVRPAPTALVVGDLSFLHDLGALQVAARHRVPLLVIVVNNDGGGIFSFLPQAELGPTFETLFGTPHGLVLAGAVTMCGGRHVGARSRAALTAAVDEWLARPAFTVIEVPSDRTATRALHARLIAEVAAAVGDVSIRAVAP